MKCNNIHIIGVPEREEREQRNKNLFEKIMSKNFPNLMNKTDTEVQQYIKKTI